MPWCNEDQVVAEDRLIGTWKMNDVEWIEIKYAPADKSRHQYQLDITYCEQCELNADDGERLGFEPEEERMLGHLTGFAFELNGELYLTTTVHDQSDSIFDDHDLLQFHMIPVNVVNKVSFTDDGIALAPLNYKWFSDSSREGKLDVGHVRWHDLRGEDENTVILTDSTERLQDLLIEHRGDPELFHMADPLELSRLEESTAPIR